MADKDGNNPAIKGRGTSSNPANRYAATRTEKFNDGWWEESTSFNPRTITTPVSSKTIISTNRSPDIPFDQSINPYIGCEHGCIYCYARPSHAYWDLSPGIDFETHILTKPEGPDLLVKELSKKSYVCKPIHIGANTDPYQPVEKKLGITRALLEVMKEFRQPFSIITKSSLILRDLDLLAELSRDNLCSVAVSVTSLSNELKRIMEPRTSTPAERLKTITALSEHNIPVSVFTAPIIPFINDHEMESILEASARAGASAARYVFLRLPLEIESLFEEWLESHFPLKRDHVMSLIRQSRGGMSYQSKFGERMTGTGIFADLINKRFNTACNKFGLSINSEACLNTNLFGRPDRQHKLF